MTRRRTARAAVAIATAVLLAGGGSALAGKPTIERIPLDGTFLDEFLTEACGVEIMTTERGHVAIRTFEDARHVEVFTINATLTAVGPGGTIRFKDVGSDLTRIDENGDLITSIHGQVPFDFNGTLVLNRDTGEILHDPTAVRFDDVDAACERLT